MKYVNALIAVLVALLLIAAGAVILLVMGEVINPDDMPGEWFTPQLQAIADSSGTEQAINIAIGIGLIVLGVILLGLQLIPFMGEPKMLLISSADAGTIRVAVDSVEQLAERTVQSNRAVTSNDCSIDPDESGLRVRCHAVLVMGSEVPTVASDIQASIKDVIERLVGVPVTDVTVRTKLARDGQRSVLAR